MYASRRSRCVALAGLLLSACATARPARVPVAREDSQAAVASITAEELLSHTRVLASDEFEGRAPGTRGEEKTVEYLVNQFREAGLKPGNPDGSYVQNVPLVGITTRGTAAFRIRGEPMALRFLDDYVAVSRRTIAEVQVQNSDVVFVGYGVVAPEYGWDDFKDVDVRGKTVVMLINDPAVPDPADAGRLDESLFRGRAMTYYGRWTYKYEIASEKGAAAAIIVHETEPAGYPWAVVSGSWGQENFDIRIPGGNLDRIEVEAWMTRDVAAKLFAAGGHDFEALKRAALRKDFRPVPLGATADFQVRNTVREVQSKNVVAKLEGTHPQRKDEYVVYSAHWDHLGRDTTLRGDQIYNGALDNASGTAALLEIAEAFTRLGAPPERSILFLAVTAEEKGLLGAKYYATNPLYPLTRTIANLNMDGVNPWGRTRDVVVVGYGNTTLDDVLAESAAGQGRRIAPDPEPEKGFYYRSDHFEFAKQGVPALYTDSGTEYIGKPAGFGEQRREEYTARDYHKVSDEVKPDWDLAGAVEDTQLLFEVGYRVARSDRWPEWKPGTEFKTRREEMLRAATR